MFDQPIIRVCLVLGSLITATYILRRVRLAKVQIEDTIFWLLFSGILLILAIFPGIAYWAAYLLGFQSPINFVYIVIIFLLLAKQFFMSIRLSQLWIPRSFNAKSGCVCRNRLYFRLFGYNNSERRL